VGFDREAVRTLRSAVVDREREIELLIAALASGAHVLLEGPPGTGKSTLLRSVASAADVPFTFVEGNAELTPARLAGHFDPAQVLSRGYDSEVFVDGPLVEALREGGLLYVEEINRVPEETLNLLITVMSEGEIHIPRLGTVHAAEGFRIVAAMNPFDTVGTARISSAVYDRVCRLAIGYQSAEAEATIALRGSTGGADRDADWVRRVVELVRRTRNHPDVRVGSSVRGTIDLLRLAASLSALRDAPPGSWSIGLDAALVALSGRLQLHDSASHAPEEIIRELYVELFGAEPDAPSDAGEQATAEQISPPSGASPGKAAPRREAGRPLS
jgi:MoxR-like ATPase